LKLLREGGDREVDQTRTIPKRSLTEGAPRKKDPSGGKRLSRGPNQILLLVGLISREGGTRMKILRKGPKGYAKRKVMIELEGTSVRRGKEDIRKWENRKTRTKQVVSGRIRP